MRKECYSCGKTKEGSIIESGVFMCYSCQIEDDAYYLEELQDTEDRHGTEKTIESKRLNED